MEDTSSIERIADTATDLLGFGLIVWLLGGLIAFIGAGLLAVAAGLLWLAILVARLLAAALMALVRSIARHRRNRLVATCRVTPDSPGAGGAAASRSAAAIASSHSHCPYVSWLAGRPKKL